MSGRRRYRAVPENPGARDALAALDAQALREVLERLLAESDAKTRRRMERALVVRAAKTKGARSSSAVPSARIDEALAFAKRAKHVGYADPEDVDQCLQLGIRASLACDHEAARAVFQALLEPLGTAEIDLGQEEFVEDVLDADLRLCGAHYAVAAVVCSEPPDRPAALRAVLSETSSVWYTEAPIGEMEEAAVEPLPDLDAFLRGWRTLLEAEVRRRGRRPFGTHPRAWLREVAGRLEGTRAVADLARESRAAEDYDAWCRLLLDAEDWKGALAAFEEAAREVRDAFQRASYHDGAALCARRLGRRDVPSRLERAWRTLPTMARLVSWLDAAASEAALRRRVRAAREACPKARARQHALLDLLAGDLEAAAGRLARSPGLGWSNADHPGHLLVPVFEARLAGTRLDPGSLVVAEAAILDPEWSWSQAPDDGDRRLGSPTSLFALLERAPVDPAPSASERRALLRALVKAAEKRLAGVTEHKRRRHYDHAAVLVATAALSDPSPETAAWTAALRERYRRYPALQRAFDRHRGA